MKVTLSNEKKKLKKGCFAVVGQCLLCSSRGMCVMAEVKQMQLQKGLKSAEKAEGKVKQAGPPSF